jgi:hypothetical protein
MQLAESAQPTTSKVRIMSAILRPSDRPLFGRQPRHQLRIHHVALIAVLGWVSYMLFTQSGLF